MISTRKAEFAKIFPRFLAGLPDGGLIMCHPGFVDAELKRLDPLTTMREREFAFFNSDEFPRLLAEHGVALAVARRRRRLSDQSTTTLVPTFTRS